MSCFIFIHFFNEKLIQCHNSCNIENNFYDNQQAHKQTSISRLRRDFLCQTVIAQPPRIYQYAGIYYFIFGLSEQKYDSDHCHSERHQPEPKIEIPHLPKPVMINEALPITFDKIISRIQFQYRLQIGRNHIKTPKNRRPPKTKLQ